MPEASRNSGLEKSSPQSQPGSVAWNDDQIRLLVTQKEGFFCTIQLAAILDLPPDEAFNLLARPDSHKIFKSISDNTYRRVRDCRHSEAGREVMQVETEAIANWKLGLLRGTFHTRLLVDLHAPNGTIDFKLTRQGGMMKAFEGHWKVRSWDDSRSLESVVKADTENEHAKDRITTNSDRAHVVPYFDLPRFTDWLPWKRALSAGRSQNRRCLVTLEQSLMPSMVPPGPLGNIVKGISASQVRGMMGDLQSEVRRINAGTPTPSDEGSNTLKAEFGFPGCNHSSNNSNTNHHHHNSSSNNSNNNHHHNSSSRGGDNSPGRSSCAGEGSGNGSKSRNTSGSRGSLGDQSGPNDHSEGKGGHFQTVSQAIDRHPTWLRRLDGTPLQQPCAFLVARNDAARARRQKWLSDVGL